MNSQRVETAWGQIVLTAAITAIFTIIAGVAVYYLTRQPAELNYSLVKMEPFIGTTANMAIYRLEISNAGRTEVDQLSAVIRFPNGKIQDRRATVPASFRQSEREVEGSYSFEAPTLNPKEKLAYSFLVSFGTQEPGKPDISIRGKGVVARQVDTSTPPMEAGWTKYAVLLLGSVTSIFSLFVSRLTRVRAAIFHVGDQAHVFAYLCFLHGMTEEGSDYFKRTGNVFYWSESDRLAALCMASGIEEKVRSAKAVLVDALSYCNMNDVSAAVVRLNIAKLCLHLADLDEARLWLKKATAGGDVEIKRRLQIDAVMRQFIARDSELQDVKGFAASAAS